MPLEEARERRLLERAARDDSLLVALQTGKVPDPFRPRPAVGPSRPRVVAETVVETPSVVLSAFDRERPEVILRIGEKVSNRLTQGQVWEGWTIVLIDKSIVELTGYGKSISIPVPNQTRD